MHINEERPNGARVTFYYLEPKQGATIKVYHTNTDEKETKFIGKIKTGKLINRTYELSLDLMVNLICLMVDIEFISVVE